MSRPASGPSLWTGPQQDPRRYRVDLEDGMLHHIGDGGEGLVFRALCIKNGETHEVALKMHTSLAIADFDGINRRAQILRTVDDPHVMHLVDAFVGTALIDSDDPVDADFSVIYTVADWIPGEPLGVALGLVGPVRAMRWVVDLARAVAYLHSFHTAEAPEGLVHRDIKPSNVRVTPDGQAVLIDFGIARPLGTEDMTKGAGTYLWQAPEVVGGPGTPGPASDAWGIGAVASWILSGEPPRFDEASVARRRLEELARQAGFSDPVGLGRHLARLLEPHPDKRVRDLGRWSDELAAILAGNRPHRWSSAAVEGLIRHSRLAIAVLSLVLVLAVVITTTAVYNGRRNAQNLAQAGELAAESVNTVPTGVKLGSLLSIEAAALASTTQTHDALVNALEQPVARILNSPRRPTTFAFSPNGRIVAEGTRNDLLLLDATTGKLIGHHRSATAVTSIAFNSRGTILAASEGDEVILWHTATGTEIGRPTTFGSPVSHVAFSPETSTTLAVAAGRTVTVRDAETDGEIGPPLISQNRVASISFAPDGTLAAGDSAGNVTFWNTTTGVHSSAALTGTGSAVTAMAFSPDGARLATIGDSGYIALWNPSTGLRIGPSLPDGSRVTSVAFEPSANSGTDILASGTSRGGVAVWSITDVGGPTPLETVQTLGQGSAITALAYSSDGATLAVNDATGGTTLWNTHTPIGLTTPDADPVTSVAISPDGATVAAADTGGSVSFWNPTNATQKLPPLAVGSAVFSIAFDPKGSTLATGDLDGNVGLWSTTRGTEIRHLSAGQTVYSVAFNGDGRVLASGNSGDVIRLWKLLPRLQSTPALPGDSSVRSLAFSPGGRILAAGHDRGGVVLWDTVTGKPIAHLVDGAKVNSVAFSPDGALLATGDDAGNVQLWDVGTRRRVSLLDDRSSVSSVAFSPNGRTLATGDALGEIIPWDVATGTEVGPSLMDGSAVDSIAFSPDGTLLASGDDGGRVFLFPSSFLSDTTDALVTHLCDRVRGNLTRHQWAQYLPGTPYRKVCPGYP